MVIVLMIVIISIVPIIIKRRSIKHKLRKDSEKDFDNRINEEVRSGR